MKALAVLATASCFWVIGCRDNEPDSLETALGRQWAGELATAVSARDANSINIQCPSQGPGDVPPPTSRPLTELELEGTVPTVTQEDATSRDSRLGTAVVDFERSVDDLLLLLDEPCKLAREGHFHEASELLSDLLSAPE